MTFASRHLPCLLILVWSLLAIRYCMLTPSDHYAMDYEGHLQYGRIISLEKRLPLVKEGWETFQPPLYYLLVGQIPHAWPQAILVVRCLSVGLGAIFLWLLSSSLLKNGFSPTTTSLALLFLATTPQFIFHFTTYNNDALANVLGLGIFSLTWDLRDGKKDRRLWGLLVLAVLGVYTKYTVVFACWAAAGFAAYLWARGSLPLAQLRRVIGIFALAAVFLSPWLILRNYRQAHILLGHDCASRLNSGMRLPASATRAVLTPPCFTDGEWTDPYVHHWETTHTKKGSYASYLFVSSVFGEYELRVLPAAVLWAILWIHLALLLIGWIYVGRDEARTMRVAMLVGVLSLVPYIFSCPFAPAMHFRFIAWTWLPISFFYAATLQKPFARVLLAIGIGLQLWLWWML